MQSLNRAIKILDVLSRCPEGASVSELSDRMGLSLSTTHRFLQSLMNNGLVIQDPLSRRYKLGLRVLSLASGLLKSDRLIQMSRDPMQRAAVASGNVIYLCRQQKSEILCVSSINPLDDASPSFIAQVGNSMPIHAAAAAKIILAYQPDTVLKSLLTERVPLPKYTDKTMTNIDNILKHYRLCREQGFAICDEEINLGVVAVAAPVFNYDGSVLGSIGVTCIKVNTSIPTLVKIICDTAKEISQTMGYSVS